MHKLYFVWYNVSKKVIFLLQKSMTIHQTSNGNRGLDANLETKLANTRHEELWEKEKIATEFKNSPEWEALKSKVEQVLVEKYGKVKWAEKSKRLFERIATNYSNKPKEERNLQAVVTEVISSKLDMAQLWLLEQMKDPSFWESLKVSSKQETPRPPKKWETTETNPDGVKKEEWRVETASKLNTLPNYAQMPEYETLERLVKLWHVKPEEFEKFKQENKDSDTNSIKLNIEKLVSTIKDADTRKKVTNQEGRKPEWEEDNTNTEGNNTDTKDKEKKQEIVTGKDIKGTDFYADFGEKINEDEKISNLEMRLARNYVSLKWANGEVGDKNEDLNVALSKVGKQIIAEQSPEFRQVNAKDIELALNNSANQGERYKALERLDEKSTQKNIENQNRDRATQKAGNQESLKQQAQAENFQREQANIANIRAGETERLTNLTREQIAAQEALEKQREMAQMGDIFWGGKLDVASASNDTTSSQT